MTTLIFRNSSIDYLFKNDSSFIFSDYDGIEFEEKYDRYIWFYNLPFKFNVNSLVEEIEDFQLRIKIILEKIPREKVFYLFTLEKINPLIIVESNFDLTKAIYRFNNYLFDIAEEFPNVRIIDFSDFLSAKKPIEIIDWRYYFLSKAIFNPKLKDVFQQWFKNKLRAINNSRSKCVVLDLDNTLWKGILGEDGLTGICLDENYPGNVYKRFQEIILELKNSGVLLAISSKNNMADVDELFQRHDEMVLSKDDFIVIKANWKNKALNIREISEELNIGLSSIVFIDDNPTERHIVKSVLPEVIVPEFPAKAHELIEFIYTVVRTHFSLYKLTNEDSRKTEQYKENLLRQGMRNESTSIGEYIKKLNIELELSNVNELNLTRFAQLTQKTNQFNLTTKRYSESNILSFAKEGALIYGLGVKDKFGNYGITGLCIIFINENQAIIDTYLLSCRILGKGIEDEFLNCLINMLFKKGLKKIKSTYVRSSKNIQTQNFYEKNGFDLVKEDENIRSYELLAENYTYVPSKNFKTRIV